LGFVFQGAGLIASLTAAENVAIVRGPDGRLATDRRGARSILGRLDLEAQADHFPHQLSGGEQQRIAVARALVGDPPLLLLDEPTAFLDRASADHVIDVLRQLRDEGRALLVASHDDHVTRLADHVVYLD
jgi:putative ABC transport system ATP-binding protein